MSEKISLFFSAQHLPNMEMFSKTDGFVVLYSKHNGVTTKIGMTNVVMDNLNPVWTTPITMDYIFESSQEVIAVIHNLDNGHPPQKLEYHKVIGEINFNLSTLLKAPSQKIAMKVQSHHKNQAVLIVNGEIETTCRDVFVANFVGTKLSNKDGFFGRSDPFLIISRMNEDGHWTAVFTSERIQNNLNPIWPQHRIQMTTLCNGDLDRPLKIEIWDHESSGKHKSMGTVETSVRVLIGSGGNPMDVIEPEKKATKKNYVNSGTLMALNATIEHHPVLAEFLAGGCEISLIVGIDFTGSNGDATDSTSLHFMPPEVTNLISSFSLLEPPSGGSQPLSPDLQQYNEYQRAIIFVGNVLEPYDSDKKYSVFGFGAKVLQPHGQYSACQHAFHLHEGGHEVNGIPGILKAYQDSLPRLLFSGPTLFEPLINAAAEIAASSKCSQSNQKYTILLIITDGEINDKENTRKAIERASNQPLSIVIVGVGNENFSSMKDLDDNIPQASRDIVHFVPFRETMSKGGASLSVEVLAEIPTQLLTYMKQRAIVPNQRA